MFEGMTVLWESSTQSAEVLALLKKLKDGKNPFGLFRLLAGKVLHQGNAILFAALTPISDPRSQTDALMSAYRQATGLELSGISGKFLPPSFGNDNPSFEIYGGNSIRVDSADGSLKFKTIEASATIGQGIPEEFLNYVLLNLVATLG